MKCLLFPVQAYEEQERAEATYKKANADGSVTRNEVIDLGTHFVDGAHVPNAIVLIVQVNKLQMQASKMNQACDTAKGKYASQLVKTNEFQSKYYRLASMGRLFQVYLVHLTYF